MCRSGTSQDKFIYASSEHFAIARDFGGVACLASLVLYFEEFRSSGISDARYCLVI